MFSVLLDCVSAVLDIIHLSVIVFGMTAYALPMYKFPKTRRVHLIVLLAIMIGLVLFGNRCWLTELSHWLRVLAHPESPQGISTFSGQVAGAMGFSDGTAILIFTVTLLVSIAIGSYLDNKHSRETDERT